MDISGSYIESFLLEKAQQKISAQNENQKKYESMKQKRPIKLKRDQQKKRSSKDPLAHYYNEECTFEAGMDEAGRGPMFGRVYSACVILPKNDPEFHYEWMKDSKRFTSHKKLMEVYNYIKEHAIDYCVCYEDESTIDEMNILQATQKSMHNCLKGLTQRPEYLLVDGNYFNVYKDKHGTIPFTCVEGGDNAFCSIAAASILAKVERDLYIENMCDEHPELDERYGLRKNKGYGTKQHMDGIKEHGISEWHRKSFGICKKFA